MTELLDAAPTRQESNEGVHRLFSLLLLAGILVLGGSLRFTGLNWDEGQYIHPDEGHMRNTVSIIRWPKDLSVYFDTHHSPLNVRNHGGHRYSYGTLPLFAVRAAAEWLDGACAQDAAQWRGAVARALVGRDLVGCHSGSFTGTYNAVVGRGLSALADLGTLVLIYLIGRRLHGEAVGLMAAGLGSVTAFMIQQGHFFTVDSTACLFTTAVIYLSIRGAQSGHWGDYAAGGVAVGLAAACKVSAATSALLVALAAVSRLLSREEKLETRELLRLAAALVLAGILALVVFRVGQPYAFEGPGFFGIRPSPEWFGRLSQIGLEQSGDVDLPSGRQWAGRMPVVFPWLNTVVWGMGLPLGLAAWIGWAVLGLGIVRGKLSSRGHLVMWGWFTAVFLYHGTQWVMSMRYFLSLYPILTVFAAVWLVRLMRASSSWVRGAGFALSTLVGLGALLWGIAFFTIYVRPHPRIAASRWIYENVPPGVTVANEHWDWGLPLHIDGHDPFGGMYRGIEMQNYNEDTVQKRQQLVGWLDEADWIFLASNRLYASIPRLPARYPLTTAYYEALFGGELGFELAADFTSYPSLGPVLFPDQENPFALMEAEYVSQERSVEVNLPPAEEAFSVYDHPRVLVFRKTEAYSGEMVRRVLGEVDLSRVTHGRTPGEATRAPNLLRFDEPTWADQQAGGTWAEMFNTKGLLNRYPGLAAVAWWVAVTVLGWLAFPLLFIALPGLRDRGYGFARLFALLAVAYLTWLAASVHLFPNTRWTIGRMVALLALAGGGLGWVRRHDLADFLRRRRRVVLWTELLFAVLFVMWIAVRMVQPDLWHPTVGGEKPMDFAYLNAVMKSTWFPPYNPWLSGTWINYYYFGFVIVGTLIQLLGTVPAIAYNLAVPLLFALTGVGAFSVAYNLCAAICPGCRERQAARAGVLGTVFVVLMGNLGVVHLLRNKLMTLGNVSFPSILPGFPAAVSVLHGLWRVVMEGASLAMRPETWYWHPTRIIPGGAGNPIAEFPAFTFLYADLHAHMIAFPLTLFAVALALHWARSSSRTSGTLLLGGLVIGALRATNTWDYPTHLLVGIAGLVLGAWRLWRRRSEGGDGVAWRVTARRIAWQVPALIGLSVALYLPYVRHYVAGYTSFNIWEGGGTPAGIYLWIYAGLLFPVVTWMVTDVADAVTGRRETWRVWAVVGCGVAGVGVAMWLLRVPVAVVALPVGGLAALQFLLSMQRGTERNGGHALLSLLIVGVMILSIVVEIVVLEGDIGRMNTVFKFYLQVWILLAVGAAVGVSWLWVRKRGWERRRWRVWWGVMAGLSLGQALFLPCGIYARAVDRMAPQVGLTLDGMAFMEHAVIHDGPEGDLSEIALSGDFAAIRWMQEHVQGSPVVLEGLGRREYLWANRVSVYTGLPAVAGWRWHQVQQRAGVGGDLVAWRRADVDACYATLDTAEAMEILRRHGVGFVYVGAYERAYYPARGLAKFEEMADGEGLKLVYDAQGVQIYEVRT